LVLRIDTQAFWCAYQKIRLHIRAFDRGTLLNRKVMKATKCFDCTDVGFWNAQTNDVRTPFSPGNMYRWTADCDVRSFYKVAMLQILPKCESNTLGPL
jgi:hypothetical protein